MTPRGNGMSIRGWDPPTPTLHHKEHYNVRVSKELGVGKAAVRRIPCACSACLAQLNSPWQPGVAAEQHPMFASSTSCIFWPIFKKAAGV